MKTLKLRTFEASKAYWCFDGILELYPAVLVEGEARKALKDTLALYPSDYQASKRRLIAEEASALWIQKQNPWLSTTEVKDVRVIFERYLIYDGENQLFARHALNEFLDEAEEDLIYGDFIDDNWDRLVTTTQTSKLKQTSHFSTVFSFSLYKEAVILLRPGASKEATAAIRGLKLSEVRILLKMNRGENIAAKSSAVKERIIALLADAYGTSVELPKISRVMMNLNRAFVKSFVGETNRNFASLENANITYSKEMRAVERKLFEDPKKINSGLVSTAIVGPVAEWLAKHADQLRFYELLAIIHTLYNPRALVTLSPGKAGNAAIVFKQALESDPQKAAFMMKIFAESIITAKTELPTIEQWLEGIEDETVANSITSEITITLLSGSNKRFKISDDIFFLRRLVKVYENS